MRATTALAASIVILSLLPSPALPFPVLPTDDCTSRKDPSSSSSVSTMVHIHGQTTLRAASATARRRSSSRLSASASATSPPGPVSRLSPATHAAGERPPDPTTLASNADLLARSTSTLAEWFSDKRGVLCITGAGLSTESGIPDYRGSNGSYHRGHQPMVHDQFMRLESQRKRYWGRSMVGWRDFANSSPNAGHRSLAELERMGRLGVSFDDRPEFYHPDEEADYWTTSSGTRRETIVTQNVDGLHRRAGSRHVTDLHGRNDRLRCMSCNSFHCRHAFQDTLDELNRDWLEGVLNEAEREGGAKDARRADGDAELSREHYDDLTVPDCPSCDAGFLKPDVVFFGDSVPRHRVDRCYAAVDAADGLLCVGTSLAVHSAFRFVRAAAEGGTPILILNVGETRAETSNLDVTKIDAPAGPTLAALVEELSVEGDQHRVAE